MTDFLKIARALEMQREDMKWYANVEAMAEALAEAHMRGLVEGQRHAIDMMVEAQQRENEALSKTVDAMPPFDESKAEREAYERGRAFERLSQAMTTEAESTEAHDREKDAYERGVNDGLTGRRERAVSIRDGYSFHTDANHHEATDDYAPPTGPVALCNEDTARESAGLFVAAKPMSLRDLTEEAKRDPMYTAFYRRGSSSLGYIARDYFPSASVPQPDGDGRFPGEAE